MTKDNKILLATVIIFILIIGVLFIKLVNVSKVIKSFPQHIEIPDSMMYEEEGLELIKITLINRDEYYVYYKNNIVRFIKADRLGILYYIKERIIK